MEEHESLRTHIQDGERTVLTLLRWLVVASLTGAVCGLVGALFHHGVALATELRGESPWLLFCMPLAGLIIVWLYHILDMENDSGTNQIIASVRSRERPPLRLMPLIFVSTLLTHLTGGSSGREGAALQIGGSIGATLGKWLRLGEKNTNLIILCGMSAVFTALFGTPLTATVFSIEVVSIGILHYSALLPCFLASLVSYAVAVALGMEPTAYLLTGGPELLHALPLLQTGLLAAACAVVSIVFCAAMHQSTALYRRLFPRPWVRILAGSALVICVTLLSGTRDYTGAGGEVILRAVAGEARPWDFAMKLLLTALTLGAGFRGGEIVPTFFIGATFGCVAGELLGLEAAFGAAVGLVAVFCGVVNCPLASILLSVELFGSSHVLYFALACTLSYLLSGRYSLYSSQKIVYSKLEPTFINAGTH